METAAAQEQTRRSLAARHPALTYFLLTFGISWAGALALVAPKLLRGEPIPKFTGLMMFPVMLLGPATAGLAMTAWTEGRDGVRALGRRIFRYRVPARWLAALLIPPALVLAALSGLALLVSPRFTPNHFFLGATFGVVAGFVEEIGWTGFAFPALARRRSAFAAALLLGFFVGAVAHSRGRLPWRRDAARQLLAPLSPGVRDGDDCDSCSHLLGLCAYRQRRNGADAAHLLYGRAGRIQPGGHSA